MAAATFLVIFLVHAIADTMNVKDNQTTDSTNKGTSPVTSTIKASTDSNNNFDQDSYTTNIWIDITEPAMHEQNCTGTCITMYPSTEYETSTSSSLVDFNTENVTFKWTNTSFTTIGSVPITVPVVLLGVGTAVMVVNALVMVAYVRDSELRRNTYHNLVIGLSLSDFLMGCSCFIVGCRSLFPNFSGELVLCILENICGSTSLIMSLFQILCISLHRFLVLSENVWAKHLFDGNRKYYVYSLSWTTAFILFSSLVSPNRNRVETYEKVFGRNVYTVQMILCSVIPTLLLLTLIFYALTIFQVWQRYKKMSTCSDTGNMEYIKHRRIIKSIKLVSMILLVLFLCSGPLYIALLFDSIPYVGSLIGFAAINVNSLLNPIIYWSHISQLRNRLKSICQCKT